jgi:hypothetical protein
VVSTNSSINQTSSLVEAGSGPSLPQQLSFTSGQDKARAASAPSPLQQQGPAAAAAAAAAAHGAAARAQSQGAADTREGAEAAARGSFDQAAILAAAAAARCANSARAALAFAKGAAFAKGGPPRWAAIKQALRLRLAALTAGLLEPPPRARLPR